MGLYLDYPPLEKGKDPAFIKASIKKINTRAENHGADKKTALDFNIVIDVPVAMLSALSLGDKTDYEALLFDDKGMVKNHGIKSIIFVRDFENHYLNIAFTKVEQHKHGHRFITDKICKFSAEPKAGKMIALKFQIQFQPFQEKDIGQLIKGGLEKECYIRLEHGQDDMISDHNAQKQQGKTGKEKKADNKKPIGERTPAKPGAAAGPKTH